MSKYNLQYKKQIQISCELQGLRVAWRKTWIIMTHLEIIRQPVQTVHNFLKIKANVKFTYANNAKTLHTHHMA